MSTLLKVQEDGGVNQFVRCMHGHQETWTAVGGETLCSFAFSLSEILGWVPNFHLTLAIFPIFFANSFCTAKTAVPGIAVAQSLLTGLKMCSIVFDMTLQRYDVCYHRGIIL